uniref:Uncharacterized protein n=1 Tax=Knipowitschia caucasica TaxID=637954 RepID=A0AAV2KRT2_KNICA
MRRRWHNARWLVHAKWHKAKKHPKVKKRDSSGIHFLSSYFGLDVLAPLGHACFVMRFLCAFP